MIRLAALLTLFGVGVTSALGATVEADVSLKSCLQDGYDIKAAFSDNNGGAYILVQKGTNAFMCHSNPSPRCEKLS